MTEQLTALVGAYTLALIISAYLALAGPERYRDAAKWCLGVLTLGGVVWLLLRRSGASEPTTHHAPDTYTHGATDERVEDIDERIAEVNEEIEATEARGYFDGGELGSSMARRLREKDHE